MRLTGARHRRLGAFSLALAVLVASASCHPATGGGRDAGARWYVAVGGAGDCSEAHPCGSIDAAYQRAGSGDTVLMASGTYGEQTVKDRPAATRFAKNVVVRPRTRDVSIVDRLSIQGSHLTIRGLSLKGFTEIVSAAGRNGSFGRIENVDATGQIFITGADDTAIVNSRVHPGLNTVAITVTPSKTGARVPTNVLIENNEVGPTWATPDWQTIGLHNSSIHVEGAAKLIIRRNLIWEGATSASLLLDTSLGPLTGVVVEDNFVAGCGLRTPPPGAVCVSYHAVGFGNSPGVPPSQIVVRKNTIRGDVVDYNYVNNRMSSGIVSGNVADGEVGCSGSSMSGNVFRPGSFWDCSLNTLAVPVFSAPAFDGISWGTPSASRGADPGVPAGAGFRPVAVN